MHWMFSMYNPENREDINLGSEGGVLYLTVEYETLKGEGGARTQTWGSKRDI